MIKKIDRPKTLDELQTAIVQNCDLQDVDFDRLAAAVLPLFVLQPELQPQGKTITLADVFSTTHTGRTDDYDTSRLVSGCIYRKKELLELIGDIPILYGDDAPTVTFSAIRKVLGKLGAEVTATDRKGMYLVTLHDPTKGLPLDVFLADRSAPVSLVADYIARHRNANRTFTFFSAAFVNDCDTVQKRLKAQVRATQSIIGEHFLADLAAQNNLNFIKSGVGRLVKADALYAPLTDNGNICYRMHLVLEMADGSFHRNDATADKYSQMYADDIADLNRNGFLYFHQNVQKLLTKMRRNPELTQLVSIYLEKEVQLNPVVIWPELDDAERRSMMLWVHHKTLAALRRKSNKMQQAALTDEDIALYSSFCDRYEALIQEEYPDIIPS